MMRKTLLALLLLLLAIPRDLFSEQEKVIRKETPSYNEQQHSSNINLVNLHSEPSTFIDQVVNVISGDYIENQIDLSMPGAEPILFNRRYSSSNFSPGTLCVGWDINHYGIIKFEEQSAVREIASFYEDSLSPTHYDRKRKYPYKPFKIAEYECIDGITNCSSGVINGSCNPKNQFIIGSEKSKQLEVINSRGDRFQYLRTKDKQGIKTFFRIATGKYVTGNSISYKYSGDLRFIRVKTIDPLGNLLAQANLSYENFEKSERAAKITIQSIDERFVKYHFFKGKSRLDGRSCIFLNKVERSDGPTEEYDYEPKGSLHSERVIRKKLPDNRYYEIDYYKYGKQTKAKNSLEIKKRDDKRINLVSQIRAPIGVDEKPLVKYTFVYKPEKYNRKKDSAGRTHVYDAYKRHTEYGYNIFRRLDFIKRYTSGINPKVYCTEKLFWGEDKERTNLVKRTFENGQAKQIFSKEYHYDERGNVLQEILEGNLTGSNSNLDTHTTNFTYHFCIKNLMASKEDGRKKIVYEYLPDTNLLVKELTYYGNDLKQRKFYSYNIQGVLEKEVVDDGSSEDINDFSGVTQRLITAKQPRLWIPTGVPDWEETRYWDPLDGEEKLIQLKQFSYDIKGRVTETKIYDNQRQFVYSENFEYDQMGNIIKHINANGETTRFEYDANRNMVKKYVPDLRYHFEYVYDFCNRLIAEKKIFSDGNIETFSYRYDYCGNKIAMVDPFGNETKYVYDDFNRCIETLLPIIPNEEGTLVQPKLQMQYNEMSYITMKLDAKGNEEIAAYTVRGAPYYKKYSDGSFEKYEYHPDGIIKKKIASTGITYEYQHDYQGRMVEEIAYSTDGEIVNSKRWVYNTFHLLEEIEHDGTSTKYSYFPDGKLKSQTRGKTLVTYEYDSLGRLWKKRDFYGEKNDECSVEIKEYDIFDRVIEERTEDGEGRLFRKSQFVYDVHGNVIEEIIWNQFGPSVTLTEYDAKQRPTKITDSEGNQTITTYDDRFVNQYGQQVLLSVVTAPDGRTIAKEHDIFGKVKSITYRDPFNKILRVEEYIYDLNGNKVRFIQGDREKTITSAWEYDCMNRVISQIEALGTTNQQTRMIAYNLLGQKEREIEPNGGYIDYFYDSKCRLSRMRSSDGTIDYDYTYDAGDRPIEVKDLIHQTVSKKKYNQEGRLVEEKLGNGLSISYTYDRIGRPVTVTYPDESKAVYHYDAVQLIKVDRYDRQCKQIYTQEYTEIDLCGNCLSAQMIGKAGIIHNKYDTKGRIKGIETDVWKENVFYDSVGNVTDRVIKHLDQKEVNLDTVISYQYDGLRRLVTENGPLQERYQYDALHNRTTKNGITCENNELNQVIRDADNAYLYDPNGNLIQITRENNEQICYYSYDALNRLIAFKDNRTTVSYQYDELNRRICKQSETDGELKEERYLYLGQNEVGCCDADGRIMELRLLGLGKGAEIGCSIAIELSDQIYAPVHDQQGNIVLLLDAENGFIADRYEYTAFGEEKESGLKRSPWRFSSKRVDEETGLVYFGRRYYAPGLGKWITQDPAGHEGGPNLYVYVDNAPLSNIDLYGLMPHNSFFQTFTNYLFKHSLMCHIGGAVGYGLKFLGINVIPIPVARNAVSSLGYAIQKGRCVDYVKEIQKECRSKAFVETVENSPTNYCLGHNGGMGNTKEEHQERITNLSKSHQCTLYSVYSSSHGFVTDILDKVLISLGIKTHAVDLCVAQLRNCINSVGGVGSDGKVFYSAHSKGGAILNKALGELTPEEKKMIHVSTYGSATIIDPEGLGSAVNFVSTRDGVPFVSDPIGLAMGVAKGHVQFIQGKGLPCCDHSFEGTYRSTYDTYIKFKKEQYGF